MHTDIATSSCQNISTKNRKQLSSCFISSHLQSPQFLELSRAVEPRHPICCGWSWSWTVPRRGIAQDSAQKSGNSRIRSARGLARLSWCRMGVPLAVQQKSTKKNGPRFLGTKTFVLGSPRFWCQRRGGMAAATAAPSSNGSNSLAVEASVARCLRRFRSWRRWWNSTWTTQTSPGRWTSWRTTRGWNISTCATPALEAGWKPCPSRPSVCSISISQAQKSAGTWQPWSMPPSYDTSVCQTRQRLVSWNPWQTSGGWGSWSWPTWKSSVTLQWWKYGRGSNASTFQGHRWSLTFCSSSNPTTGRQGCGSANGRNFAF